MESKRHDHTENPLGLLLQIRRRLRWLLVLDGLAYLFTWTVLGAVLLLLLDWWVGFPSLVRMWLLLAGLAWFVGQAGRRVARPAIAPISLDQLAIQLGHLTPDARDRLPTAISFLKHGEPENDNAMWNRVVENTQRSLGTVSVSTALNARLVSRAVVRTMLLVGLVSAGSVYRSDVAAVGWKRILWPVSNARWPTRVQIEPITHDAVVAIGEAFTARMKLPRGDSAGRRAYLVWENDAGERQRRLMNRDAEGTYHSTLDNLRGTLTYGFSAGDADTLDAMFTVLVVPRPGIAGLAMALKPPAYVRREPTVTRLHNHQPITALAGSRARLEVDANKPLESVEKNWVLFKDGRRFELERIGDDDTRMAAEFDVGKGGAFSVSLIDEHGLRSRGAEFSIDVIEDALPVVSIISPANEIELTPRGTLELTIEAEDDFAIESLSLVAEVNGDVETEMCCIAPDAVPTAQLAARHEWILSQSGITPRPGDVIDYAVEVTDSYDWNGERHPPVRSAVRRVRIVSMPEYAEILRQRLFASRSQLRRIYSGLQSVRNQSQELDTAEAPSAGLDEKQRATAIRLARELRNLGEPGRRLAAELGELADAAERNRASQLDVAMQADRIGRKLGAIDQTLESAARALLQATENTVVGTQRHHVSESIQSQEQLLETIRQMFADLEQWNDYADMVRLTMELLDRQERGRREVEHLGRTGGGVAAALLTPEQRSAVERAYSVQDQLKQDTAAHLRLMGQLSTTLDSTNPMAADALHRAIVAANRWTVLDRMAEASAEIRENRMHKARGFQEKALVGLRAMLTSFEEKPDRQLASLQKKLSDLTERLGRIIETQESLIDQTGEARSELAMERLANRQSSLGSTTDRLAGRVESTDPEAVAARGFLQEAIPFMNESADWLDEGEPQLALPKQAESRDRLLAALEKLQAFESRTEQKIAERSMNAIREALVGLMESQRALKVEVTAIEARQEADKPLPRAEGIRLIRLSKQQTDLQKPLDETQAKMLNSIVYQDVCEQVRTDIQAAAKRLKKRDSRGAISHQDDVLMRLGWLVASLERPKRKKGREFASEGGGGAGGGTPEMDKPVPPLAELKVLRIMQVGLQQDTRDLHVDLPAPAAREDSQVARIAKLGDEQRRLHALCQEMVRQAEARRGDHEEN